MKNCTLLTDSTLKDENVLVRFKIIFGGKDFHRKPKKISKNNVFQENEGERV